MTTPTSTNPPSIGPPTIPIVPLNLSMHLRDITRRQLSRWSKILADLPVADLTLDRLLREMPVPDSPEAQIWLELRYRWNETKNKLDQLLQALEREPANTVASNVIAAIYKLYKGWNENAENLRNFYETQFDQAGRKHME